MRRVRRLGGQLPGRLCHEIVGLPGRATGAYQLPSPAGRLQGGAVSQVAIVARVTVKQGKAEQYVATFAPLLEQARKEPGTLLYGVGTGIRQKRAAADAFALDGPGVRPDTHNGTATGDSGLNPVALPPTVAPMWVSSPVTGPRARAGRSAPIPPWCAPASTPPVPAAPCLRNWPGGADRSPRSTPQTCSPPRRPAGLTRNRSPGRTSPAGAGPWFCRGQRRRLPGAGLRGAPARPGLHRSGRG